MGSRLLDFWFRPVAAIRLEAFQRLFSVTFFLYMVERARHGGEWLTEAGFHITPKTKGYWHVDPFPLLSEGLLPIFLIVLFGSTACLIVGWRSRWFVWVVLACAVYIQNADIHSAYTLNKLYIVTYAVLAVAPRAHAFSRGSTAGLLMSAWPLRTLQATIVIQYTMAGWCKVLHGDWVGSGSGDVLWTHVQGVYCTDVAAWMLRVLEKEHWAPMMYSALAFELCAPLLFCIRRLRPLAYFWGLGFHLVIAVTMHQLVFFSVQLLAFYVLFFDPAVLEHFRERWHALPRPILARKSP